MEALLLCNASSPPLLSSISYFSNPCRPVEFFRCPLLAKAAYNRNALVAVTAAPPPGRRSMVVMAGARPERQEESALKMEKEKEAETEAEKLTPEELEKLETAVMDGKDEGRTPLDYDRRARIFYESSRVFQDLKDTESLNS